MTRIQYLDQGRRDEALGFGLELRMLTPYVLAVAAAVLHFHVSVVADAVREESKPLVTRLRRQRKPSSVLAGELSPLRADQVRQVRDIVHQCAGDLHLDEAHAVFLADSVVAWLWNKT